MIAKRKKHYQSAKSYVWVIITIALFLGYSYLVKDNHQNADLINFPIKVDHSNTANVDHITTASLRGSNVIHPVSHEQLVQMINAKILRHVAYNNQQLHEKILYLNELSSTQSKCFRVEPYSVDATSSEDWTKIDYDLVGRYIDNGLSDERLMSREKIMADIWLVREAALQAEETPKKFPTFGLYILKVQETLVDSHRFYGEDGYKWAKKLVSTEYDRELADYIKQIIPSKFYTRRLNENMQLFSQDFANFIPCSIRAQEILREQASSM